MRRGLAFDRQDARAQIESGRVTVGGAPAANPERLVDPGEAVVVVPPPARFVSRGGEKLDAALERFHIEVDRARALDAGASTGGFTDCLLQRGAASVLALDVGYGQLHERLRSDPRVCSRERSNLRDLDPSTLAAPFDVVVGDLSFISLRMVAGSLVDAARAGANGVVLVKPQFEASRAEADRGRGVVTDPIIWRRVLTEVIAAFGDRRASIMGAMVSPLRGSGGNVEFLLWWRAPGADPALAAALTSGGLLSDALAITLDVAIAEAREMVS